MPNRKKVERSANYSYYSDLLWCTVPLIGMSWYYYGARPVLLLLAALLTAYLCDCALAPLHGTGYQSHEPSSECFAALIALLMPASISYPIVISAVIVAVLVKEAFGGEGHYPFHPAAVGVVVAGISWPQDVFSYPIPGTQLPLFGSVNTTLVEGMNATLRDGGLPSASTMNLLTGNVSAAIGTSAALVVMACGLFLLVRGHIKLSVVIPFFIFVIGLPWFFPNLNELPTFSLPWEYIRQRFYLEKYVVLSGTALFTGLFLVCEPVTMPDRRMSRIIYGAALGIMTYVFRVFSPYECAACCALLIVSSIPEWLDLISHRTERIRFMREEEQRLANSTKPEYAPGRGALRDLNYPAHHQGDARGRPRHGGEGCLPRRDRGRPCRHADRQGARRTGGPCTGKAARRTAAARARAQ